MSVADLPLHRLSTAQFDALVRTGALEGTRVELLDGLLVDMSPPRPEHYYVIQELGNLMRARSDLLRIQGPIACAEGWTPEPDVALAVKPSPREHPRTALLAVEVMVTGHREARAKLPGYALARIPVVWLVDVPERRVEVLSEPQGEAFSRARLAAGGELLDPGVEGIEPFTVARVFELALDESG